MVVFKVVVSCCLKALSLEPHLSAVMEISQTNKGHSLITFEGYTYRKDRENIERISWRCAIKQFCSRIVIWKNDNSMRSQKQHLHFPDTQEADALK